MFYHTPTGCGRGDNCKFFHLTKSTLQRVKYIKQKNKNAFTNICVPAITGNCNNSNCEYLHPIDDVRYREQEKKRLELECDNVFLCANINKLEEKTRELEYNSRKDKDYIERLKSQRNSTEKTITDLKNDNRKLRHEADKASADNKYLKRKIERLKQEHSTTERQKKIIDKYLKKNSSGSNNKDELFIPLNNLSEEVNNSVSDQKTRPYKRRRYFETDTEISQNPHI